MEERTRFLVYCIEIYKTANKISGREVIRIFNQYGIMDYIIECYGALHTTGPEYIVEVITEIAEDAEGRGDHGGGGASGGFGGNLEEKG